MLDVKNLISGYGKSEVIRGISLEVKEGQIVAIIGPNGAGKTTFFRTIFGFLPARQGEILFENEDLTQYSPTVRVQKGIAMVPQGRNVFPFLTVLENLKLGAYTRYDQKTVQEGIGLAYSLFPVLKERSDEDEASSLGPGGRRQHVSLRVRGR